MQRTLLAAVLGGVFGGLIGAELTAHVPRVAAIGPAAATELPASQAVLSASRFELRDSSGHVRAELAMSADGGPALFFFDSKARNRLVLGLYSKAEYEAPSVVLNDPQGLAAGIFRLFGPRDTPVLVLKNQGRDRSIYGLNPRSTDPFLTSYSSDGTQRDVFGHY